MSKEELKKLKEKVEDLQEELEELTDEELEQIFGGIEMYSPQGQFQVQGLGQQAQMQAQGQWLGQMQYTNATNKQCP